jgi:hypothetical protein
VAFRQYTSCIKPSSFNNLFAGTKGLVGSFFIALIYLVLLALTISSPRLLILAGGALSFLIVYLEWWLHGRLICLSDEDECLIGVALGKPGTHAFSKSGDNDASFNVALAPSPVDLKAPEDPNSEDKFSTRLPAPKEQYWQNAADPTIGNKLQGFLIEPNAQVLALGRGYVSDDAHLLYLKSIHCEFEGSGIKDLLDWAYLMLALLLVSAALTAFPEIRALLVALALLLSLIGIAGALGGGINPGDPQDVLGNMGTIKTTDILVLKGNWVYDSLHDGWNEIHAIHACQIIGSMDDDRKTWPAKINTPDGTGQLGLGTPDDVKLAMGIWCLALQQAEKAEQGGNRDDPKNYWVLHPLVDGCSRDIIL